jgi:hypothetical protein
MDQFYIQLFTILAHGASLLFCLFSIAKRWGYYWILPSAASMLFFLDTLLEAVAAVGEEPIVLEGTELFLRLIPAAGALLWFISLIVLYYNLFTRRFEQVSQDILLSEQQKAEQFTPPGPRREGRKL